MYKNGLFLLDDAFRGNNLEELLAKAPKHLTYKPSNNGFYLSNDSLRISYTVCSLFGRKDHFDLWFLSIDPKISVNGSSINMKDLPRSAYCDYVCVHTGSTWSFISGGDGILTNNADTVGVNRHSIFPDSLKGKEEWFEKGTNLLKIAAEKYRLKDWHSHYQTHGLSAVPLQERSFFGSVGKIVRSLITSRS